MNIFISLLCIWLIPALIIFLIILFGNYSVKFTNYTKKEIIYLDGIQKIGISLLLSILWPYIFIKNILKGEQ
jgi:hypothetical protein